MRLARQRAARRASTLGVLAATLLVACSVPQEHYTSLADVLADVASDGTSLAPTLTATPSGALAFGDVVLGMTSGPSSITIANIGPVATGPLAVAFDDAGIGFSVTSDMCSGQALAGMHTCTFSVVFAPSSAGAVATVLHVTGSPGGDLSKSISGTGLAAGLVDIVDGSHDFGSVRVDAAAATHDFIVRNTGQVMIGAPQASIGGDVTSYAITANTCVSALAPSDTCKVTVAFDPAIVGQKAASLTVISSGGGSDSAILTGTGTARVTVTLAGNGLVTSSQPGINCGTACDAEFSSSPVTLSAQALLGSSFMGWGVDCSGSGTCLLTLDASKTVTATFTASTFPLTVTKMGPGTVTSTSDTGIACGATCSHGYPFSTMVTLTAAPDSGAAFVGWSGDCAGSATCTVTVDRARSVTATFTTTTFALTVSKTGAGTGTVVADSGPISCGATCSGSYAQGAMVVLTATPDAGSGLASWTGCTTQSGNTCNVTMAAATTVTATFAPGLYALTIAKSGTGTVDSADGNIQCGATCNHDYAFATMITLTAAATGGSVFDHWSGGSCNGSTSATCAFAMPATPLAITAVFTYALTVTRAGNGTGLVTSDVGGISCGAACTAAYTSGTSVTLTAVGTSGSTFVGWGGDCTGTMATCVVAMSQVRNVTATFSIGVQTLTVAVAGNGTGTVTSSPAAISCAPTCTSTFALGAMVVLMANATSGTFAGWTGDCTGTGTCTVTMDRARKVTATFSAGTQPLMVTMSGAGGGTVTSTPAGINCTAPCSASFTQGQSVTLHAAPNGTSTFGGWTGDCTNTTGDCVVTMTQARTVNAIFNLATARLTVAFPGGATGTGNVTPSPVGTPCGVRCWDYALGTSVTLTATPDSGSSFGGWSAPCSGTGTCTITMNTAVTETATFVSNFTLTVTLTGDGSGTVTGSPGGIACTTGSSVMCTASYPSTPVTMVTLTAAAMTGSVFIGWGGACSGTSTCSVTMSQAQSVTAQFTRFDKLAVAVAGSGVVNQTVSNGFAGPSCGTGCTNYTSGSIVQLTANANSGAAFKTWTGDCAGQGQTCQLTMDGDHSTTANFIALDHLAITVVGSGTVTSTDSQISCAPTCGADYPMGTVVMLNAAPNPGSVFFGWSGGGCTGTGTCSVTMDQAKAVTATFYFDLNLAALGGGTITAGTTAPPGIACTPSGGFSACLAYAPGTSVSITEAPSAGHTFTGFSGDCTGTGLCSVPLDAPRSVTANFKVTQYPLTVSVITTMSGQGSVSSSPAGINNCAGSCTASFDFSASVILTATPDANNGRFVMWTSGPCSGSTMPTCTVVMPAAPLSVGASFDAFATMTIKMNMAGTGRLDSQVSSNVAGINCTNTTTNTGTCVARISRNTVLTLTYGGVVNMLPMETWYQCAHSFPSPKMVKVVGSGDCVPGTPSGTPLTSTCSLTVSAPGAYTSEADVTCQ